MTRVVEHFFYFELRSPALGPAGSKVVPEASQVHFRDCPAS